MAMALAFAPRRCRRGCLGSTAWWCVTFVVVVASASRHGRASSANPAGCGRAPGFGSSRRPRGSTAWREDRRRGRHDVFEFLVELTSGRSNSLNVPDARRASWWASRILANRAHSQPLGLRHHPAGQWVASPGGGRWPVPVKPKFWGSHEVPLTPNWSSKLDPYRLSFVTV